MAATLERFVFSPDANHENGKAEMLARLFSGLLHPLIHFGHGPEFGLPGMAAEGKISPKWFPRINMTRSRNGRCHQTNEQRPLPTIFL